MPETTAIATLAERDRPSYQSLTPPADGTAAAPSGLGVDLGELQAADRAAKDAGSDDATKTLLAYYEDGTAARDAIVMRLAELGMGLANDRHPLQPNLLRRVVERLAVCYDRAPTRSLLRPSGKPFPENSGEHQLMLRVLRRSSYDASWKRADRLRALLRQVAIRFYPSDARGAVVARAFEPHNIWRDPDPAASDMLDHDRRFALRLSGEVVEFWEQHDGLWSMAWVDEDGTPLPEWRQPFAAWGRLGGGWLCPYAELPVQMVYDEHPGGRAYLSPRVSRIAWVERINALLADVVLLVQQQAHTQITIQQTAGADPNAQPPSESGPGSIWMLPPGMTAEILDANPKIQEAMQTARELIHLWMISEDLPGSELDSGRTILTGAALKVEDRPLLQRREAQVPLAVEDERMAWRRYRAVHNLHARAWKEEPLALDTELEVEIADLEIAEDAVQLLDALAREMAIGAASTIDAIQRLRNVPRSQAIKIYERVQEDREEYPANPQAEEAVTGPQADVEPMSAQEAIDQVTGEGHDSMVDAVNGVSAGERRDERRVDGPALEVVPAAPAAVDSVQDTALNGAQVQAALEIVQAVGRGELPRDAALGMLQQFFQLSLESAEAIMGSVGAGFSPEQPEPPAPPPPGDSTIPGE